MFCTFYREMVVWSSVLSALWLIGSSIDLRELLDGCFGRYGTVSIVSYTCVFSRWSLYECLLNCLCIYSALLDVLFNIITSTYICDQLLSFCIETKWASFAKYSVGGYSYVIKGYCDKFWHESFRIPYYNGLESLSQSPSSDKLV